MSTKRKSADVAGEGKKLAKHAHRHTNVQPTGLGQQISSAPGRLAQSHLQELCTSHPAAKWAPHAVPQSACPSNPAAAVELELERAAALDKLRHKLASLCAKAGLRNVPLLAFERWRFAAKWAEDEPQLAMGVDVSGGPISGKQGSKKSSRSSSSSGADPVLPFGHLPVAPEPGLVSDLTRAGLSEQAATDVALQLAGASAAAAASVGKRQHQLASGKAPTCPDVKVAFYKHSLDLTCSSRFVKVSRASYGKFARLYRMHWSSTPTASTESAIGLPIDQAAAKVKALKAAAVAGQATTPAAAGAESSSEEDDELSDDHDGKANEPDAEEGGKPGDSEAKQRRLARLFGLCAESRIAELEQQQQQEAAAPADRTGGSSSVRDALHQRLFALLLRYKSIQGHGFQAAAGPAVFELLRQKLHVGFECFASPLNAHFSRYGSAFPDVDGPFGSSGSFFRLQLMHGSYEANPPFVPSMLTATAQHVLALLQQAEAAAGALSFTVLMPGWEEVEGWQMLNSSPFLRKSLLVAAADHGYCDGASHQRSDLYRQSPYDSGILFLQTTAAAAKWPVRDDLMQQLRDAMASCCPSAAAVERQRKRRGLTDLEWRGLGAPVLKYDAGLAEEQDAQVGLPLARQEQDVEKAARKKQRQQEAKKKRKHEQQQKQQPKGAVSRSKQQQQQQQKHKSKKKQKGRP